jgi:hypothetical protein
MQLTNTPLDAFAAALSVAMTLVFLAGNLAAILYCIRRWRTE